VFEILNNSEYSLDYGSVDGIVRDIESQFEILNNLIKWLG